MKNTSLGREINPDTMNSYFMAIADYFSKVRLVDVEGGRANNLNLIRLILASSVILSHSYAAVYQGAWEPMVRFSRSETGLGDVAVIGFFFLSGYLILKSAIRQPDPAVFLKCRALRLGPGLVVTVLLATFVVGAIFTSLPLSGYFSNRQTYQYLLNVILCHSAGITLPGLFQREASNEVNSPLWTLASEWTMYLLTLLACMAVRWRSSRANTSWRSWAVLGLAVGVTAMMFPLPWKYSERWALAFITGAAVYLLRRWIILSLPLAFSCFILDLAMIRILPIAGKPAFPFALSYLLLVLGFHPSVQMKWYLALGDISYGLYIYAWPIQQILASHFSSPLKLFVANYLLVLPLAALSWYAVESPCLSLKHSRASTCHRLNR